MSENNTQTISILDAKISDAKEDVAKAQAKLDKLLLQKSNEAALESIAVGSSVSFEYGRGEKRRELTGTVTAAANDEKQGRMLAVSVGEGFDLQVLKIRAADVTAVNDAA